MEVQVAETGPCSRSLHITIPKDQVSEHMEQLYASAQRQVQIKGFRPGKVPRKMLEKLHGPQILAEAKEQLLNRYFGEAVRKHELQPVGRIEIEDFDKLELKPDDALQFTAKIDVRPTFDLPETKGIEVPAYEREATDDDVANALKEIAHQKRTIQKVDAAVEDGDFVKCDYTFVGEGGDDVHERKGVQLNTRIPIHGVEKAAYSAALVGKQAGETTEMAITFPANFEKEEVRGKQGVVRVAVHEVLRVSPPPIDDELAKSMEFDSLDALRADLRERISHEKERLGKMRQEDTALEHLANAADMALPPSMVEEQVQASLNNFGHRMRQQGVADEEIEKKLGESKAEAEKDAQRRVRLFFLIDAIARKNELRIDHADVQDELQKIADANSSPEHQLTAAQVQEHLQKENRLNELQLALLERKVRDFLRDNAKIVDKSGS